MPYQQGVCVCNSTSLSSFLLTDEFALLYHIFIQITIPNAAGEENVMRIKNSG
jgi:predicted nucleic acid-binding protein